MGDRPGKGGPPFLCSFCAVSSSWRKEAEPGPCPHEVPVVGTFCEEISEVRAPKNT